MNEPYQYRSPYFPDLCVYAAGGKTAVVVDEAQAVEILGAGAQRVPDDQPIEIFLEDDVRHFPQGHEIVRDGSFIRATAKAWAEFEGVPGLLSVTVTAEDLRRLVFGE